MSAINDKVIEDVFAEIIEGETLDAAVSISQPLCKIDHHKKGDIMSTELIQSLAQAINCHSAENGSNTPDFILAEFLADCLGAFDKASRAREKWYGKSLSIGGD